MKRKIRTVVWDVAVTFFVETCVAAWKVATWLDCGYVPKDRK